MVSSVGKISISRGLHFVYREVGMKRRAERVAVITGAGSVIVGALSGLLSEEAVTLVGLDN